jgi:hypothetical protein
MGKFLSIDRKVILKSAVAGVSIISLLSLALLIESVVLWSLAFFGVLATYWFVPAWFSRDRQIERKSVATPFKDLATYGSTIPEYKIVGPEEGKEVKTPFDKEKKMTAIFLCFISTILVFIVSDPLIKLLLEHYPNSENIIIGFVATICLSTPYLVRHLYCFTLNDPMDTSLEYLYNSSLFDKTGSSYIRKLDITPNKASDFATNPIYSSLPCNIYYYMSKFK